MTNDHGHDIDFAQATVVDQIRDYRKKPTKAKVVRSKRLFTSNYKCCLNVLAESVSKKFL